MAIPHILSSDTFKNIESYLIRFYRKNNLYFSHPFYLSVHYKHISTEIQSSDISSLYILKFDSVAGDIISIDLNFNGKTIQVETSF